MTDLTLSERLALAERRASESEARARVAEGAAEIAIKEAGEARDRLAAQIESHRLTIAERDTARADVAIAYCPIAKGVWFWQGDNGDRPESLTCPVVMSAETLRALVAYHDAEHVAVTPEIRAAVEAVREADKVRRWYASSENTPPVGHDLAAEEFDRARLRLADLILAAMPAVKP